MGLLNWLLFYLLCFQIVQVAQRLEQLSVTREEYYLLKALVLVNCDVRVESLTHVKKLRETVLSALSDCSAVLRYWLWLAIRSGRDAVEICLVNLVFIYYSPFSPPPTGKAVELASKCTLYCSACRASDKLTALSGGSGLSSVAMPEFRWTNSSWRCSNLPWGEFFSIVIFFKYSKFSDEIILNEIVGHHDADKTQNNRNMALSLLHNHIMSSLMFCQNNKKKTTKKISFYTFLHPYRWF